MVFFGGVHILKPQNFHQGAAHGSFSIQHIAQIRALYAVALGKGAYAPLPFDRRSQQENNVPIIQYEGETAHLAAREYLGDFARECDWSFSGHVS